MLIKVLLSLQLKGTVLDLDYLQLEMLDQVRFHQLFQRERKKENLLIFMIFAKKLI